MIPINCSECGKIIDTETESYYIDEKNSGIRYCYDCTNKKLGVPALPSLLDTILYRFDKLTQGWVIFIFISAVAYPTIAVIAPGWWKIIYCIIGAFYLLMAVLYIIFLYKKYTEQ